MRTLGLLAAAATLLPTEARADCALPETFVVTQSAGTVTVCLQTSSGRTCPDQGLLRRRSDGSEVVKITSCEGDCFLDECVPAGDYQYGLAQPYQCQTAACDTAFYVTASIAGAAEGCIRTIPTPEAASGVPWTDGHPSICVYGPKPPGWGMGSIFGCGVTPARSVLGTNLLFLLAGAALWRWRPGRRSRA
jgi:hypothetical protein